MKMMFGIAGASLCLAALSLVTSASAGEVVFALDLPETRSYTDLTFPDQPTTVIGADGAMFKPDGPGPFPGLVLLPTCNGHRAFLNTFDWANRALAHGYAVIVVDPLSQRHVQDNCSLHAGVWSVPPRRFMKDGFDAADHLRKQPFVDPDRIGLMGFSEGAMAGLEASSDQAYQGGRKPFGAIVAAYPICKFTNYRHPTIGRIIDIHYLPDKVSVPLLVEMGDLDTETHPQRDCVPQLDQLKAGGAPVEYRMYNATHNWDATETQTKPFRKAGLDGELVVYEYNEAVTAQSEKDAFTFLDAHLKSK
jgi:dienelactone hydrolase